MTSAIILAMLGVAVTCLVTGFVAGLLYGLRTVDHQAQEDLVEAKEDARYKQGVIDELHEDVAFWRERAGVGV